MTYEDTEEAFVSLRQAMHECREHGATAMVDGSHAVDVLAIYDADNGDHWGDVVIKHGDQVNARAVLAVLGY